MTAEYVFLSLQNFSKDRPLTNSWIAAPESNISER